MFTDKSGNYLFTDNINNQEILLPALPRTHSNNKSHEKSLFLT